MAQTVGVKDTGTQPRVEALTLHPRASQILVLLNVVEHLTEDVAMESERETTRRTPATGAGDRQGDRQTLAGGQTDADRG
jgi:hypothetical protein